MPVPIDIRIERIFDSVPVQVLHHIQECDGKASFHRGIEFVLRLHADRVGRGIGFVIKGRCRPERAVGIQREEGIVSSPTPLTKW